MAPSTSKHFSDSGVLSTFLGERPPLEREFFRLNERFLGAGMKKVFTQLTRSHGPELLSDGRHSRQILILQRSFLGHSRRRVLRSPAAVTRLCVWAAT